MQTQHLPSVTVLRPVYRAVMTVRGFRFADRAVAASFRTGTGVRWQATFFRTADDNPRFAGQASAPPVPLRHQGATACFPPDWHEVAPAHSARNATTSAYSLRHNVIPNHSPFSTVRVARTARSSSLNCASLVQSVYPVRSGACSSWRMLVSR